jgi:hypothetical protein
MSNFGYHRLGFNPFLHSFFRSLFVVSLTVEFLNFEIESVILTVVNGASL